MKTEDSYFELIPPSHNGTAVLTGLEAISSAKIDENTRENKLAKEPCDAGPDREAVDDDNEHPRKDAHCHLQLRSRVRVIFIALDEVSTTGSPGETEDGNREGDYLGGGDGAGGQDDLELDDALGTRF